MALGPLRQVEIDAERNALRNFNLQLERQEEMALKAEEAKSADPEVTEKKGK